MFVFKWQLIVSFHYLVEVWDCILFFSRYRLLRGAPPRVRSLKCPGSAPRLQMASFPAWTLQVRLTSVGQKIDSRRLRPTAIGPAVFRPWLLPKSRLLEDARITEDLRRVLLGGSSRSGWSAPFPM